MSLFTCFWSLGTGYWSLGTGYWSLVTRYLMLDVRYLIPFQFIQFVCLFYFHQLIQFAQLIMFI
ncbi:MAG: hypothetical protein JW798_12785, partial [Prolixibacteraceae bacterium]|nr:hypothetical protein [Prolixibacteraceae bacterium]